MSFQVTVTPIVQEVEVNASVTPYEVDINVVDGQDLTLTTIGTSGVATYNPFTGLLNIPNYSTDLSGVVPTSRTLTINGVAFDLSENRTWTVGDLRSDQSYSNPIWLTDLAWSKITVTPTTLAGYGITDAQPLLTNPVTGTGTSGQVSFWNGTTTQTGSNNLFWNNANSRLGIGTNSPLDFPLVVQGSIQVRSTASSFVGLRIDATSIRRRETGTFSLGSNDLATAINIFGTNNIGLNTTTDAGFRLDVNGTARVQTSLMVGAQSAVSSGVKLETDGVFRAWTRMEIGQFGALQMTTSSLSKAASGSDFFELANTLSLTATTSSYYFLQLRSTVNPTSGVAVFNGLNLNFTINQTGGANGITRGLYVNPTLTAAADWRSIEWSNNSGWGLYGAGTANNYLAGNLGIGTTSPLHALDVNGASARLSRNGSFEFNVANTTPSTGSSFRITASTNLVFVGTLDASPLALMTGATERIRLFNTGNLAINTTTDAGFRLDVNGTARVQGNLTTNLTAGSVPFIGASGLLTQNNSNLFWDNVNSRLGIGTNAPATRVSIVYSDNNYNAGLSINNENINPQALAGIGFTVNTVLGGFMAYAPSNYANVAQRSTMLFTSAGNNKVGIIANSNSSGVAQDIYFSTLGSNSIYALQIKANGNIQINTNTDAGFRLDVNGTARVQSTLKVGAATATNASAVLDVESTTRGFLPPRMTTAQRDLIATPAAGLVIYNTSTNKHQGYNGTTWNDLY